MRKIRTPEANWGIIRDTNRTMKITKRAEKETVTKEAITCALTTEEIQEEAMECAGRKLTDDEVQIVFNEVQKHFEKTSQVVKTAIGQLINATVI